MNTPVVLTVSTYVLTGIMMALTTAAVAAVYRQKAKGNACLAVGMAMADFCTIQIAAGISYTANAGIKVTLLSTYFSVIVVTSGLTSTVVFSPSTPRAATLAEAVTPWISQNWDPPPKDDMITFDLPGERNKRQIDWVSIPSNLDTSPAPPNTTTTSMAPPNTTSTSTWTSTTSASTSTSTTSTSTSTSTAPPNTTTTSTTTTTSPTIDTTSDSTDTFTVSPKPFSPSTPTPLGPAPPPSPKASDLSGFLDDYVPLSRETNHILLGVFGTTAIFFMLSTATLATILACFKATARAQRRLDKAMEMDGMTPEV